jgi:hypothetical protein
MYRRTLSLGLVQQISLWLRLHFVQSRSYGAGQAQRNVKSEKKESHDVTVGVKSNQASTQSSSQPNDPSTPFFLPHS